ncbi:ATP-binding protein [Methylobacterium sp. J-078]|uniref:ATP-binding protein n=1 Tax=Methylobacterium sp. J-078 TaxID=2836657 RepID=UPI001FB9E6DC|nr:ATP-binding protein [Methylobacterium sp. J-078]MCJ2044618.1 ATP-binding protein [Methylobacterium sp. J-078]
MVESLRGVGYSIATALADIVDNSISAGARNVWVTFAYRGAASTVSILDDGGGMSATELLGAMTLGGISPLLHRAEKDLGRFGLGLKTASFSQCRCLTVASRRNGLVSVRRWDLDYIARPDVGDWRLLSSPRKGSEELLSPLDLLEQGTLVLWEGLDRIVGPGGMKDAALENAFLALVERVEQHLAMVFHRLIEGMSPELRLYINGHRVKGWDPFLRSHPATYSTPTDPFSSPHGRGELQGFVLPHKDKLSEIEYRAAGGIEGWTSQQGFYVYRNQRLLVAGGWLGLGSPRVWTMEEPFKLARIRLDFTNSADHEWDIDVKKSTARPPRYLRARIQELAENVRVRARRVFAHRGEYGARAAVQDLSTVWVSRTLKGGTSYRLNRDHPLVARALNDADSKSVSELLRLVEETVPVQRIWLDTVEKGEMQKEPFSEDASPEVEELAKSMLSHLVGKVGLSHELAVMRLRTTEPFQNFPQLIARLSASPSIQVTA